jgi:hypothetical protein
MCVILIGASYCALLVANLTLDKAEQQVETVEQLAATNLKYTDVDNLWPGQVKIIYRNIFTKYVSLFSTVGAV